MSTTANIAGQFGDTTYTKVFVGGLAWETQKEAMKKYFEQFGEILEAVVIVDKASGRSKGYGFVTFREAEAATKACVDAAPVIDGRRANCNLASLGVQRCKPPTPKHGGGRNFLKVMKSMRAGLQSGIGAAFPSSTTFPHYVVQHGIPYNIYGYSSYSPGYSYSASYHGVYGAATAQYPLYGGAAAGAFYPYLNYGEGGGGATNYKAAAGQGYALQYPNHLSHYSAINSATGGYQHQYGSLMSLVPTTPSHPVCFAVPQA